MAFTRIDPFRELATLHDRMNRVFDHLHVRDEELGSRGSWVPAVDIFETAGRDLVIKAELPDMGRDAIEVTVEHNTLTLTGTRNLPADVKEEQFRRVERSYGTFSRSFRLPSTVDSGKVTAEYKNGVLTITLPFREEAKPRTVAVEVAAA